MMRRAGMGSMAIKDEHDMMPVKFKKNPSHDYATYNQFYVMLATWLVTRQVQSEVPS